MTNLIFFFLQFDPEQNEQAVNCTARLMKAAKENPDNAIDKVFELAREESKTTDPDLIRWSLMSFVTHHPAARKENLRIAPLIQRSPESSVPKKKKVSMAPGPVISDEKVGESEGDLELFMNWYREDPNLNEHHEHWHIVYQNGGIPDLENPDIRIHKDRHGELFVYMHRQMLARYDIERHALNLPLIKPITDYRAPIEEGYKPNENLVDTNDDYSTFGFREPHSKLRDVGL
jgi:tyrosinase